MAAIWGFVAPPIGMLYVAQIAWAALYLFAAIGIGILVFIFYHRAPIVAVIAGYSLSIVCAIHSYILAGRYPADKVRPHYSRWYGLIGIVIGIWAVSFGFRAFVLEPFSFPSRAMIPTITPGSTLVVQKWGYGHYSWYDIPLFHKPITAELQRGDLIVFDYPENRSIQFGKRLVALPGDRITYRDKKLSVNGKEVTGRRLGEYSTPESLGNSRHLSRFAESLDGREYSVVINDDVTQSIFGSPSFPLMENCVYDSHGVTCNVPAGYYYILGDNRDNSRDSRYFGFVPAANIVGKVIYTTH